MVAVECIRHVGDGAGAAPDADMAPEDTVVSAEDTVVPVEDTVVPAEDTVVSAGGLALEVALEVAHNTRAGLEGLSTKYRVNVALETNLSGDT